VPGEVDDARADLRWPPTLTGLAALLADGKLRALDVADRLAPHAAAGTPLALLVTHIRALEFDAAAIALATLAPVSEAGGH
jgi:hypothetical protein